MEWTELVTFLGGGNVAANKMISPGTTYWTSNPSGTNQSGFSALPGGIIFWGGSYNIGLEARFWSSTELQGLTTPAAWSLGLDPTITQPFTDSFRTNGFSVRCLKD